MENSILFSIVIPTFNRVSLLEQTLNTFLAQTYPNFEIIVVDDGGTDNTKEVIKILNDARINYFWKENAERGAARNFGASKAKGAWINFFDSDDWAYPHHLQTASDIIMQNPTVEVFHVGQEIKEIDGQKSNQTPSSKKPANERLLVANFITPNALFVKRQILNSVQYCEDRALAVSEDWFFHLQLAARYPILSFSHLITNCIVQHNARSMVLASGTNVLLRSRTLVHYLEKDISFSKTYPKAMAGIKSEMFSLAALHFSLEKNRINAIKWLWSACINKPSLIMRRRFFAILKHLF